MKDLEAPSRWQRPDFFVVSQLDLSCTGTGPLFVVYNPPPSPCLFLCTDAQFLARKEKEKGTQGAGNNVLGPYEGKSTPDAESRLRTPSRLSSERVAVESSTQSPPFWFQTLPVYEWQCSP